MIKFAFVLTNGNDCKTIAIYNTKAEAMEQADRIKKSFSEYSGLLSLESADCDEGNNRTDNKCRVYEVWKWKGNGYA